MTLVLGHSTGAAQQQFKTASPHVLILVLPRRFFSLPCNYEASCLFHLCWGGTYGDQIT